MSRQERAREARTLMNDAAAVLRTRTSQAISAGHLDKTATVPPYSRYTMAALLEALAHDVTRERLSEWTTTEAIALARSILKEDAE